jgi:hypothetical protein
MGSANGTHDLNMRTSEPMTSPGPSLSQGIGNIGQCIPTTSMYG